MPQGDPIKALVEPTLATPFGKVIPLVCGTAIVEAIPFYVSKPRYAYYNFDPVTNVYLEANTIIDFAVLIGHPDPTADTMKLNRIYDDGELVVDGTNKAQQSKTGYNYVFYAGDEDQRPNSILAKALDGTAPALRGLMYIVFTDYVLRSGSSGALPQILVEVEGHHSDRLPIDLLPRGPNAPGNNTNRLYPLTFNDKVTQQVFFVGSTGIDVYQPDVGALLYSMDFSGLGFATDLDRPVLRADGGIKICKAGDNTHFYMIMTGKRLPAALTNYLAYVNIYTGVIEAWIECPFYFGSNNICAVNGAGQWDEYLIVNHSALQLYGRKQGKLYFIKQLGVAYNLLDLKAAPSLPYPVFWNEFKYYNPPSLGDIQYKEKTTTLYKDVRAWNEGSSGFRPSNFWKDNSTEYYYSGAASIVRPVEKIDDYKSIDSSGLKVDTSAFSVAYGVTATGIYRIMLTDEKTVLVGLQNPNMPPLDASYKYPPGFPGALNPNTLYNTLPATKDPEAWHAPKNSYRYATTPAYKPLQRVQNGDAIELIYSNPALAAKALFVGPDSNPFISVITNDKIKTFDTFWSRRNYADDNPGLWQSNFYIINAGPYNGLVNLTMRDALWNICLPYPEVVIPGNSLDNTGNISKIAKLQFEGYRYGTTKFTYLTEEVVPPKLVYIDAFLGDYQVYGNLGFQDSETGAALDVSPLVHALVYDQDTGYLYLGSEFPGVVLINGGVSVGDTPLSTVIRGWIMQAGYTADQITITNLNNIGVRGSVINQTTALSDLLDAAGAVFGFDYFDTDGRIHVTKRAKEISFTFDKIIYQGDLLPLTEGEEASALSYERIEPGTLPTEISFDYIDRDFAYSVGTQTARRTTAPFPTIKSNQPTSLSLPVAMSSNQAAFWVAQALFQQWAQSITVSYRLAFDGALAEPGDYHKIIGDDGYETPVRVLQTTLNGDRSTSIKAVSTTIYDDYVPPVGPPDSSPGKVLTSVPTQFFCPDNVLLYPADDALYSDEALIRFYWASNQDAGLYGYDDDIDAYAIRGQSQAVALNGLMLTVLPILPPDFYPSFDRSASFEFVIPGNDIVLPPTPNDETDAASGRYACIVGGPGRWELIYYLAASYDETRRRYTVSGLARGRRGTDAISGAHETGEAVVFIPQGARGLARFNLAASLVGAVYPVQTAPASNVLAKPVPSSIPYVGLSQRPWAPCNLKAERAGADTALSWTRRSRTDPGLRDDTADVPLDEPAEGYIVVILDLAGVEVLRTIETATASALYTAAMATEDYGIASPTHLTWAVQQTSSRVPDLDGWPAFRTNQKVAL